MLEAIVSGCPPTQHVIYHLNHMSSLINISSQINAVRCPIAKSYLGGCWKKNYVNHLENILPYKWEIIILFLSIFALNFGVNSELIIFHVRFRGYSSFLFRYLCLSLCLHLWCSAISWHFLFRPDGIKTLIYINNYSVSPSFIVRPNGVQYRY